MRHTLRVNTGIDDQVRPTADQELSGDVGRSRIFLMFVSAVYLRYGYCLNCLQPDAVIHVGVMYR